MFYRWGKRAAHNRAQIVYYMAENIEIRREELANRISEMTGKSSADSLREVDLSINRLFHWGAYCDKYGGAVQVCIGRVCCVRQYFIFPLLLFSTNLFEKDMCSYPWLQQLLKSLIFLSSLLFYLLTNVVFIHTQC